MLALEAQYEDLQGATRPRSAWLEAERGFAEVTHRVPMLSLANAFDEEDVANFDRRCREAWRPTGSTTRASSSSTRPRGDARVEDGLFVQGATRG